MSYLTELHTSSTEVVDSARVEVTTANNVATSVKEGYDKYKDQMVSKATDVVKDVETELDGLK